MNAPANPGQLLPDLDSREQVERFVRAFYDGLLEDPILAPIFMDVARVDLEVHLPHIIDYWCKLLLKEPGYQRHTMNIHRRLHGKQALRDEDFSRWLGFFLNAVAQGWRGDNSERAKRIATTIAGNMRDALSVSH